MGGEKEGSISLILRSYKSEIAPMHRGDDRMIFKIASIYFVENAG